MTIDKMVELLKIEHECILRNTHGDCDRQCEDCELVQDDGELHEMYENVIGLVEAQEPVAPVEEKRRGGYFRCGNCNARVSKVFEDKYCSQCGRAVKWDA